MSESAIVTPAVERRRATAARITAVCRQLTFERGLGGFTVEEVCSEVGISRRTFFNYFPSKEEGVFGVVEHEELEQFAQQFLARGSRGWPAVVDDLVESLGRVVDVAEHNAADHAQFMAIMQREPKLLARFIGMTREREQSLVELVALREGVHPTDRHARAAVDVISALMRSLGERLTDAAVVDGASTALADSLAAMREVLTPTGKARS